MGEKTAIFDELLMKARIYLNERTNIVIKTVEEYENIPSSCFKCGESLREIYTRPEEFAGSWNNYDLVVSKCEQCNLFYAVWIQPLMYGPTFLEPTIEDERAGGRIMEPPQWKQVGKPEWAEGIQPKFPKEAIKAYTRANSQVDDIYGKLNSIIKEKLAEMYRRGLSIETINIARNKALVYLKNNSVTSSKKLLNLWAAAIYEASREELVSIGGAAWRGEKLSERKTEEIFGITRKTIRKWRKLLPYRLTNLHL